MLLDSSSFWWLLAFLVRWPYHPCHISVSSIFEVWVWTRWSLTLKSCLIFLNSFSCVCGGDPKTNRTDRDKVLKISKKSSITMLNVYDLVNFPVFFISGIQYIKMLAITTSIILDFIVHDWEVDKPHYLPIIFHPPHLTGLKAVKKNSFQFSLGYSLQLSKNKIDVLYVKQMRVLDNPFVRWIAEKQCEFTSRAFILCNVRI